jgi:hypothetical protein
MPLRRLAFPTVLEFGRLRQLVPEWLHGWTQSRGRKARAGRRHSAVRGGLI